MACSYHNTLATECIGHRGTCASNRPLTSYVRSPGTMITATQVAELIVRIKEEVARWNVHRYWESPINSPSAIKGYTVFPSVFNKLDESLGGIYGSYLADEVAGNLIGADEWNNLIARYNVIRTSCICNSDCSCNSICACYGDCGCNYSDERLKENITFFEKIGELNVYSYNYKADSKKTYKGVIAQELIGTKYSEALNSDENGFYYVNYNLLPINMELIYEKE